MYFITGKCTTNFEDEKAEDILFNRKYSDLRYEGDKYAFETLSEAKTFLLDRLLRWAEQEHLVIKSYERDEYCPDWLPKNHTKNFVWSVYCKMHAGVSPAALLSEEYFLCIYEGERTPEWEIETVPLSSLTRDEFDGRIVIGLSRQNLIRWDEENEAFLLERANTAARLVTEPCVCIARTSGIGIEPQEFRFAHAENKGLSRRHIIFNAAETETKDEKGLRVGIYNTGTGPLTKYWYKKSVKYQKGNVF